MRRWIRSRAFLKTATIASASSLGAILFLLLPASAEHIFDTDVRIETARSETPEGGRITISVETVDGKLAPTDLHVYLSIDGTATEGSGADYTITGAEGGPLLVTGDTLYDRKVVIPRGTRAVTVSINTRNDSEAEQCEFVRVQGLQWDGSHKAFVGIFGFRIAASDLGDTTPASLPSVDLTQIGDTWTATLTDPRGVSGSAQWYWHRATRENGPWTQFAYDTAEYTLTEDDRAYFLRAEARYINGDGAPACAHVVWNEQGRTINPGNSVDTDNNGGGGTSVGRRDTGDANTATGTTETDDDEEGFTDLDTATEHTKYLRILYGEGVLDGTGCRDAFLCPNGPLLRWEAAIWFVRVLDGKNPENISPVRFADVDSNVWYAPYIERLAELQVTVGCSEDPDHYCPDKKVTRAQMATLLVRAFDLPEAESEGFTDTSRTIHAPNIDASHAAGIADSCSVDPLKFCPREGTSRAEMATYLVRGRMYAAQRTADLYLWG